MTAAHPAAALFSFDLNLAPSLPLTRRYKATPTTAAAMYNPHIYLPPTAPPPVHVHPPAHAHALQPQHTPPTHQPPPHVMHAYGAVTSCHGGVTYPALPMVSAPLPPPPPPLVPVPQIDEPLRHVHDHEQMHMQPHGAIVVAHEQQLHHQHDHEHLHPHDIMPQEPLMYVPTPTPTPTSPARKRKRHTRTTTGCQSCRVQRVKCPEGPVLAHGKIACRRCWEVDRPCFYPVEGTVKRGKMKEERWVRAVEAGPEWNYDTDGGVTDEGGAPAYEWSAVTAAGAAAPGSTATSTSARTQSPENQDAGAGALPVHSGTGVLPAPAAPAAPAMPASTTNALLAVTASPVTQTTPVAIATWISNELVNQLLNPAPPSVLTSFSLANLSSSETDRSIVSYFESQGCNEICAATTTKSNWIFAQLFPRLLTNLFSPPPEDALALTVGGWLFNCLMHLCYVHRGNVETDQAKSWHWKAEAQSYRQKASYAILRAKVRFPEDTWKTEEYL